MATVVWFYIGYALRKEYISKKEVFISSFKDIRRSEVERLFRLHFIRRYSKILTVVFITAIPWYMIMNGWETKGFIVMGIFGVAALICWCATESLTRKIDG